MANSGHRNTFRNNQVLDNGNGKSGYGFYVAPCAGDLVIENNRIAETRTEGGTQRIGIYKEAGAGSLHSQHNAMSGHVEADYREGSVAKAASSRQRP